MGLFSKLFGKLSPQDQFAKKVGEYIEDKDVTLSVQYDKENFALTITNKDQESHILNLVNLYRDCQAVDDFEHPQIIERYLSGTQPQEIPSDFQLAKKHLFPRIRHRAYENAIREIVQRRNDGGGIENFFMAVDETRLPRHLYVEIVWDFEGGIQSLNSEMLTEWGISLQTVKQVAYENLQAISTSQFEELSPGLYKSAWQDCYDISRLLFPELIRQLTISGQAVVAPFTRNDVLICGSADATGIENMAQLMLDNYESVRVESVTPLVLTDNNTWQTYVQMESEPGYELFRQLAIYQEARDYEQQKQWLQQDLDDQLIELFVASYMVFEDETSKRLFSAATYSKDVKTLLPKAEKLVIMETTEAEPIIVDWDKAWELLRNLFEDTEYFPVRYKVVNFPDNSTLDKLKSLAN